MNPHKYYIELNARLETLAHKDNAIAMKKYMRNKFEFYGIKSAIRKGAITQHRKELGMIKSQDIDEFVHYCWDNPYREVQYSCIELIDREINPPLERLKLYEWMVLNRSWWDSVDFIAPCLLGRLFSQNPKIIIGNTERFVQSGEIWLQRSALIFQLKYRAKTDLDLLFHHCKSLAQVKEFFIRKAIGWGLRQAGKFFPVEVLNFVNTTNLSPLSRKEALKHLTKEFL
jgi:3-methyladenine DNA glycosylase AlkD